MKNRFIILLTSVFLTACSSKQENPPIEKNKFIHLLIEMHLIEAEVSFNVNIDQNLLVKSYDQYKSLFSKNGVDSTLVNKNFDYYKGRNQELLDIYKVVKDSIIARGNKVK